MTTPELPDTPVGRQVAWLFETIALTERDDAEVEARFAPAFLEQVPVSVLTGAFDSLRWVAGAALLDVESEPLELKGTLVENGTPRSVLTAAVEDAEPHRFTGLQIAPSGPSMMDVLDSTEALTGTLEAAARERYSPIAGRVAPGGVVVGVTVAGKRDVFAFGADPKMRYEIGSITKTFTGLLLADAVLRGKVQFADPLRQYVPDEVSVPREPDREITLVDLATHTSGLPRLPPNMFEGSDPANPYVHFDETRMYAELSATELEHPIGSKNLYSNFAVALLGLALARAAGKSYADLLDERIAQPLGMSRTGFDQDGTVQAYSGGEPIGSWRSEVFRPAGIELASTVDDMLAYVEAALDPVSTPLAEALTLALTPPGPDIDGPIGDRSQQALGWLRIRRQDSSEILFHNGGTGGFRSSLFGDPAARVGVVALCNGAAENELDVATVGLVEALVRAR